MTGGKGKGLSELPEAYSEIPLPFLLEQDFSILPPQNHGMVHFGKDPESSTSSTPAMGRDAVHEAGMLQAPGQPPLTRL